MNRKRIILFYLIFILLTLNVLLIRISHNSIQKIFPIPKIDENVATFIIDGKGKKLTCSLKNNCYVKAPILEKTGAKIIGWSKNKDSKTSEYISSDNILLKEKYSVFYAILEKHINVATTYKIGNYIIEIEDKIPSDLDILNKIEFINEKMPFLFKVGGKISFLTQETYNELWPDGKDMVGLTEPRTKTIDIVIKNREFNPLVLIHELSHNLDWNCVRFEKLGTYKSNDFEYFNKYYYSPISYSETLGFNHLYLKYKNSNKKPLRNYSYKDIKEFFADSIASFFENKYLGTNILGANEEILELSSSFINMINDQKICEFEK